MDAGLLLSLVHDACRKAGARWVGKTRTDELSYSISGRNAHFGTPLNGLFGCNPDQKNRPDTVWRCAETRRALIELQVAGLQVSSFSISDVLELDNLEPANLQPATIVEVAR